MTTKEKKQAGFLGVLLALLAGVWFFGYNRGALTGSTTAEAPANKPVAVIAGNDARIRLDLIQPVDSGPEVGRNNPFAYRLPPPPLPPPPIVPPPPLPRPPTFVTPTTTPGPPPPPAINLKYQGISTLVDASGKKTITAILFDSGGPHPVNEGDFLFGKYKIAKISETQVDIEDQEYNRKQSLPYVK